jgi:uncharacterized protein YbjQ (UPF0145 family)
MVQAMYEARHEAIGRMTAECAGLGGHGIVGVSLTLGEFPFGGLEFRAVGTAVRAAGIMTRHDARVQLTADVARMGAEGVVVSAIDLRIHDRECPSPANSRDHLAEVTIIGTAIARFSSGALVPAQSLTVLSLDHRRRQATRARLR